MPRYALVPTPSDDVRTATSASQVSTEIDISNALLRWLDLKKDENHTGSQPVDGVILTRSSHISYLYPHLFKLASQSVCLDSGRSWIMYWIVGALSVFDTRFKQDERLRSIRTIMSFQHPEGGFSGGPNQVAHLASTYACVASLVILLEGADQQVFEETCAQIDRKKMLEWMLSLKMPDGSFRMHHGGEIDARSCFGALTVATLLNILTPELVRNVPEYLVSCQTYEGGLCATSLSNNCVQPQGIRPEFPSAAPVGEAHGGYNSCALACDFLLEGSPSLSDRPRLDYHSCLRWAAQMQGLPIEGGGFRGRTNKLVDGCYSWWCAGAFPLLRALMPEDFPDQQESFDLFDRQALQEYILLVSQDLTPQAKQGGLRDKPSAMPDMYHTHYILSGLSLAQHSQKHSLQRIEELKKAFKTPDYSKSILGNSESESEGFERMKEIYSRALAWEVEQEKELVVGLVSNKVLPVHPVLNIKHAAVEKVMKYFYDQ
ncbi:hypothetical protein PCANC_00308 [Puccinia coronata f. sp. avenae]|uniref:Protein farnesyltransferase subunit beta n=1 Tax=Puccinia coronata f. sp. avenae TaxID=200324 RepID=A0A2N5W955_9BASI|nr:hypothetical protein PCANC_05017 [Puccinia coronata f. sp. avenae]PLW22808.1 hypothetical protein PCASD_12163 [Puccinia coronata f. sp. avenae]PLW45834.1 hypothetical protein PCASD_04789 [Puccinia coronata f. sp. avenae]PLW58774.1 hypothetical protein PCANC_00308 [Puccinia coronata f. sp. avenae]